MADVTEPPSGVSQQPTEVAHPNPAAGAADAAAEALAALQGAASAAPHQLEQVGVPMPAAPGQAPGAPAVPSPIAPGTRIPGMGRGTSLYRGVSKAGDKKKWRAMIQYNHMQHHVGYYATAEDAARAYDRKALLFMGPSAITNFPPSNYAGEDLTADGTAEEQAKKRRRTSTFRGVTKAGGKWKAAIRANNVKKDLGVFEDEVEAARAYDAAAVQLLGASAVTNFNVHDVMAALPQPTGAQQPAEAAAAAPDQAHQAMQMPLPGAPGSVVGTPLEAQGAAMWQQLPAPPPGNGSAQIPLPAPPRFHGVRPAGNGKWHAQVLVDVGRFDSEEDAARAYDRAAVWCLGLTAQTNFPVSDLIQPGPVNGGQQAPVQAAGQEQQDQGVPSDSDDLDRGREAAEAAAAPDLAPNDLAAGPSNASFGQESLAYHGGQYMDGLEMGRQQSSGQEQGPSTQLPVDPSGQAAAPGGRPGKASRFVGLSKKFNRWKSLIKVCGRRKELGSFLGEEEAARCYDRHSVLAWGARARTNFNPLELLAELPKEAQTVLDAVSAGRRERADSSAAARGGGAISEAVASALVAHPAGIDSSTHEGQLAQAAIASAMAGHSYKRSAHRGVSANWSRWRAQIYVGGRRHELGSFATEAEAARAYDLAAIKLYGPEKAKTNFPVSDYATYLGATAGGAGDGANVGNGVADVSADAAPPSADAQAMSVDIQALVAAQLRAAGQPVGQPSEEDALQLGHMLAQASHAVPPQPSQLAAFSSEPPPPMPPSQ
ncbi:hypothetical protein WJX75_002779 [Coccomyxa subellipsoidea]|uniref:AP2/ERF domain-containing protein n=1 Tax=Coccomyxa subellipsoidea TaxID=248742 RepID=A0ABR2YV53_9CHLO